MTGGMTAVLFILLAVLVTSMSAGGEKFRAVILVAVTLLLSSTPFMGGIHDALMKMIQSF